MYESISDLEKLVATIFAKTDRTDIYIKWYRETKRNSNAYNDGCAYKMEVKVGVLALQGSFREHISHLNGLFSQLAKNDEYSKYKFQVVAVKTKDDLRDLKGLILCGGESTTISILMQRNNLLGPLRKMVKVDKLPVWGTCCGMIMLCNKVTNTGSKKLGELNYEVIGGLNATVDRNSFGRQVDSFSERIDFSKATKGAIKEFNCVFIRAPVITDVGDTEVLGTADRGGTKQVVAVTKGNILGTSFHPELVDNDYSFHKWFIDHYVIGK